MANEQISMPAGIAGITRYFEEFQSKVQLKPEHVAILAGAFVAVEILIRL